MFVSSSRLCLQRVCPVDRRPRRRCLPQPLRRSRAYAPWTGNRRALSLEELKPGLVGAYVVTGTDPDGKPYGGRQHRGSRLRAVRRPGAGMGQRQAGRRRRARRRRAGGGASGPTATVDPDPCRSTRSGSLSRQLAAPHRSGQQGHRGLAGSSEPASERLLPEHDASHLGLLDHHRATFRAWNATARTSEPKTRLTAPHSTEGFFITA